MNAASRLQWICILAALVLASAGAQEHSGTAELPAAVQPAAVQPAAVQPAAIQPAAIQPAAIRVETVPTDSPVLLSVSGTVPKTRVYLDGIEAGTIPFETRNLEPGFRHLSFVKEGYRPRSLTVEIQPYTRTEIYVPLEPLSGILEIAGIEPGTLVTVDGEAEPFSITGFRPRPARVNPRNPGQFGTVRFEFLASGPGEIRLAIFDPAGMLVAEQQFAVFMSRTQTVQWYPEGFPDGLYRAEISGNGIPPLETFFELRSGERNMLAGLFRGTESDGPVPAAAAADRGNFTMQSAVSWNGTGVVTSVGAVYGISYSIEAGTELAVIPFPIEHGNQQPNASFDFSLSVKKSVHEGVFPVSIIASWSASSTPGIKTGFSGRYGARVGIAAGAGFTAFDFALYSGVTAGNAQGFFPDAEASAGSGCSFALQSGPVRTSIWAYAESGILAGDFFDGTQSCAGASACILIPDSSILFGADAGLIRKNEGSTAFASSMRFGIIF